MASEAKYALNLRARWVQEGWSLRFTLEAHSKIGVRLWIGAKELDGHIAARLHIKGLPDLS